MREIKIKNKGQSKNGMQEAKDMLAEVHSLNIKSVKKKKKQQKVFIKIKFEIKLDKCNETA